MTTAPYYEDEAVTLHHGDALEVLRGLPDASVDAVVTDPPYGLEFMGKDWDGADGFRRSLNPADVERDNPFGRTSRTSPEYRAGQTFGLWCLAWAEECLRVLKPGGHLLAFGGTRTWHRLACAVEDAGFEVRDSIAWLYGSGFPKSLDVSKAIDKDNGRKFEDRFALGRHIRERREAAGLTAADVNEWFGYRDGCQHWERQDRSGARVPTLADWHILQPRLGLSDEHRALVERVEAEREITGHHDAGNPIGLYEHKHGEGNGRTAKERRDIPATPDAERWQGWGTALKPAFEPIVVARKPLAGTVAANVLAHGTGALNIDGCRVGTDGGTTRGANGSNAGRERNVLHGGNFGVEQIDGGRWPANVVLDESQARELDQMSGESSSNVRKPTGRDTRGIPNTESEAVTRFHDTIERGVSDSGGASRFFPTFRYETKAPATERPRVNGTAHPTVKPLALMRWLVRLVTPPGGTVLEPFAGSGTTVEACLLEGFKCIAIEREADYLPLIVQRINRRRDPVEAVKAAGEDGGLFDLLGEETA